MAGDNGGSYFQKRADGVVDEAPIIPSDSSMAMVTTVCQSVALQCYNAHTLRITDWAMTQSCSVERSGPIPPEITDQIINNLCGYQKALRQCALTCRAWRPRSQLCLNHTVTIDSRAAMKAFAAHLRDPRCLPYLHSLIFSRLNRYLKLTVDDHFVHLVPLVLPQVLESVKVVTIDGIAWDKFPPHPTFQFLPTQFPHVVSLTLYNCIFRSQKELFIVLSAFPSLSYLELQNIGWPQLRIPSVLSTLPRMRARLRELHIKTLPESIYCILDFLTRCPQCLETLRGLTLYPMNRLTDNAIMRKFIQVAGPSLESLSFWDIDHGVELFIACTHLRFLSLKPCETIALDTLVDRLSSVVSREFRQLHISIDTGDSEPEKMLLQWHRLDDVFMQEQFRMLTNVTLRWEATLDLKVKPVVWAKKFLKQFAKLRSRGILEVGICDCTGTPILEASAGSSTSELDDSPESDCDSEEEDLEVSSEKELVEVWLKFCSN
ncbi:hypothetical protein B0H21DRAFT_301739 [Amylocystis lapponica]|nr:hypothetical protein B0H21DRAFT_301739 [Amylocystis lapponica]